MYNAERMNQSINMWKSVYNMMRMHLLNQTHTDIVFKFIVLSGMRQDFMYISVDQTNFAETFVVITRKVILPCWG